MTKKGNPKIFHGPANIGGLGGILAQYQRQVGLNADFCTINDRTTAQNHDYDLNTRAHHVFFRPFLVGFFFLICLIKYDVFHFYFGKTFSYFFGVDLPLLKLFRKKLVMTYCGSEVRLFDFEMKQNPYLRLVNHAMYSPKLDRLKKIMMWWHNLWIDEFIAIRSLYHITRQIIPDHKIMHDLFYNNPIDLDSYVPTFQTHDPPVIVHAPSQPLIKGSSYVEQAIAQLKQEGLQFRYLRLEKVPLKEARRIYREEADIIVDQLLAGDFGYLAVEGMSYGKPVCCYLTDSLLRDLPKCPLVNCTIDTLTSKLRWLIQNPEERTRIGREGRAFVAQYCNVHEINRQLIGMYKKLCRYS